MHAQDASEPVEGRLSGVASSDAAITSLATDERSSGVADGRTSAIHVEFGELEAPHVLEASDEQITEALRDLLESEHSRLAAQQRHGMLEPHVWLVCDLGSAETAHLGPWLKRLHEKLTRLQVFARVYILGFNRTWSQPVPEQVEVERRVRTVVADVLAPGQIGDGKSVFFVITDRNAKGGVFADRDSLALACRFAEAVMLGDLTHSHNPNIATMFASPLSSVSEGWERFPVFASIAGNALNWEAERTLQEHAEERRSRLVTALDEAANSSWKPEVPALSQPSISATHEWPTLELPRWAPSFWRSGEQEFQRLHDVISPWLSEAAGWRHAMLVEYDDAIARVRLQADEAWQTYRDDMDGRTKGLLLDDLIPGFFSPVRRLYERALSTLRVQRADLGGGDLLPVDPSSTKIMTASISSPDEALAGTDADLIANIGRKPNARLVLLVATSSGLLAWLWTLEIARNALLIGGALLRLGLPQPISHMTVGLSQWQPPGLVQAGVWAAVALGAALLWVLIWYALRSRVRLERGFQKIAAAAETWRDDVMTRLPAAVSELELAMSRSNLNRAEVEVNGRAERLDRLREAGDEPALAAIPEDPVVTSNIKPPLPPPVPLSHRQAEQVTLAFRRSCIDDPTWRTDPRRTWRCLYERAARIAGDPVPDLRAEVPRLIERLRSEIPPGESVRVLPGKGSDETLGEPPLEIRLLEVPAQIAADLDTTQLGATIVPIPISDRFYTLTVQVGMRAGRVLVISVQGAGESSLGTPGGTEREVPNGKSRS
jgi:hypothetical protein